ncbi:class I SAM-dependent methyltransferase [Pseudoclavibacter soli]|uniref:class I SAM-dependent methyltransferase n=1 Tax=Pseudoclavibacter soli TaxID=452623 RepID=UPI000488FFC9|nr:class I SAM-dependent methyltransferase [Pseudoclavibacter soli]
MNEQQHADDLAAFWEHRYATADQVWSGRVNPVLAEVAADLPAGSALDLGCGEGGDAVWLAQHGWQVTGVDLSSTAVARGDAAARQAGIEDAQLQLIAADLSVWRPAGDQQFDLVTASYLHSWSAQIDRPAILRRAAGMVAPGGHLLITAHAERPPWARQGHDHGGHQPAHVFPTPESDVFDAVGDGQGWRAEIAEKRPRRATGPNGETGELVDSVVLLKRSL